MSGTLKVEVKRLTDWSLVAEEARRTAWKPPLGHDPSSEWKRRILLSRHSPIQALLFQIRIDGIGYCHSVHLVRHHVGIDGHWVSSQRPDRSPTGASRHDLPQDAPVGHDMVLNAQAILNISKKRLCAKASPETRAVWTEVRKQMYAIGETELADCMMPECGWTGYKYCPEMRGCGLRPPLYDVLFAKDGADAGNP